MVSVKGCGSDLVWVVCVSEVGSTQPLRYFIFAFEMLENPYTRQVEMEKEFETH